MARWLEWLGVWVFPFFLFSIQSQSILPNPTMDIMYLMLFDSLLSDFDGMVSPWAFVCGLHSCSTPVGRGHGLPVCLCSEWSLASSHPRVGWTGGRADHRIGEKGIKPVGKPMR